jgi:RNA polymerase II subunit A C-terminal domain phosphatase SSU72
MNNREQKLMKAVLIINLEVKDNHEEAAAGAKVALELCKEVCLLFVLVFILTFMLL